MLSLSDQPLAWLETDREFHMLIFRECGSPRLVSIIRSLRDDFERYIREYISIKDNIPRSNEIHGRILEAFEAGDAERSERYQLEHLDDVLNLFKSSVMAEKKETPD